MPLLILILLIAALTSLAYPFIGYYLYREWVHYRNTIEEDYAQRCLYGAIAMVLFILVGRFLIKALLSRKRKSEDEPHLFESTKQDSLKRPDGSIINIEYYGKEDGSPIIFIHGLNANIKNWYYQKKYFEQDYRLIMMDLPGMGKSRRPSNKDFSMNKMADDLRAVIEHTGASDAILWGHSMGGMVILSLLAKERSQGLSSIKGIVLQHTTYTNPVRTMSFSRLMTAIQKPVLVPICHMIIALSPLIWISRWMSYLNGSSHIATRWLTFTGTQTSRQLEFTTLLSTLTPPAIMARGCLGMFNYDVTNALSHIQEPALIIAADSDMLTRPDASIYMKKNMPNAELKMLTPANHQGLVERHKDANEAASQFIRALDARKEKLIAIASEEAETQNENIDTVIGHPLPSV